MQLTLEQRIRLYHAYKSAYYTGEPLISDEEFDTFEEELIADGYDPIVGFVTISNERKHAHRHQMLSLGKHKVHGDTMPIELAQELFNTYGPGLLSWKYDGLAADIEYTEGHLTCITTRGNGIVGQNVTEKLKHLVPSRINSLYNLNIRCEVVMVQQIFDTKYSMNYKHSRNLVAGIVNDIDVNDKRKYDLSIKVIEAINDKGFIVDPSRYDKVFSENYKEHVECLSAEELCTAFNSSIKTRNLCNVGNDGMVYAKTTNASRQFAFKGNKPLHAVAIKFKPIAFESIITNIHWSLHKSSRYSPIIEFSPITVDGRMIHKASGHNLAYLVKHNLTIGSKVKIVIHNDIIPGVSSLDNSTTIKS